MSWYHLGRLLGPAEVLGPIVWECRKPNPPQFVLTSHLFFHLFPQFGLPLENFLHALLGRGHKGFSVTRWWLLPNALSSSSSLCPSKKVLAGTSSIMIVGVLTAWRQLLKALVMCSVEIKTRPYAENTLFGRKFYTGKRQGPGANTSHPKCAETW